MIQNDCFGRIRAMSKKVLLTGDRPTGPLHIGHYIGSLKNRVKMQDDCETFIMVADAQAFTDNFDDIDKVRRNIFEVVCDYLAVGIDPEKSHIFIQSYIPELPELTLYLLNTVSIQRIGHNPTVKSEMKMRGYNESVPAGFYLYPMYQVADITAFGAHFVPVGKDQAPMMELTRDVVKKFNDQFKKDVLVSPEGVYPGLGKTLPGCDGQKMSKSLGNAIYLSDENDEIVKKLKKMKSDPDRKSLEDGGDPEKVVAFSYLDIFHPDQDMVSELKEHYKRGGLPDKDVKEKTTEMLISIIEPIRERRKEFESNQDVVFDIINKGTEAAREKAAKTLDDVKSAMGINYSFMKM